MVVAAQRLVRPVAEGLADQRRQHATRTGLDEDPRARRVHRLDLVHEPHPARELRGQPVADVGVRRRRDVRPHRESRLTKGNGLQTSREPVTGARHQRTVERGRDRDVLHAQPGLAQHLDGVLHSLGRAGDHDLLGRVVVGHHDIRRQQRLDRGKSSGHRGHRAGVLADRLQHRLGPRGAEREQVGGLEHTGGSERDQFAVAVATGQIRPHPDGFQQRGDHQPGDAQCRLSHPGVGDRRALPGDVLGGERGRRVHHVLVPGVDELLQPRESRDQVEQHARPLAALSRVEERDLRPLSAAQPHDIRCPPRLDVRECLAQAVVIADHERGLDRSAAARRGQ